MAEQNARKTVWLFGAGASRHYNLNSFGVPMPLARDFFKAMSELPTSEGLNARIGDLTSYVWRTRRVSPQNFSEFSEDIESFMTSIESRVTECRESGAVNGPDADECIGVAMVATNMGFVLANVINEAQNGPPSPVYDELLRYCGPKDVFVTLNWDTLLDRSLAASGCWEPNRGYGIKFDGAYSARWLCRVPQSAAIYKSRWKLIKLHGSTNWLTPYSGISPTTMEQHSPVPGYNRVFLYWEGSLPFETHASRWRGGYANTCYGYYPPNVPARFFPDADLRIQGDRILIRCQPLLFDVRNAGPVEGVPTSPLLITPVRQKRYSGYSRAIDSLWRSAHDAFQAADRIVLVGYSFPETDVKVRELVTNALLNSPGTKEVEVVDLNPEGIEERMSEPAVKAAADFRIHRGTLEDYVAKLAGGGAELMRKIAETDAEVRGWIDRLRALSKSGQHLYGNGG